MMSECLGGRSSHRQQLPPSAVPARAASASAASAAHSRAVSEEAATAAAARERASGLTLALERAESVAQSLADALQQERAASSAARAAAAGHTDALALLEAKYECAVRAGRTMAALEARPLVSAQTLYLRSEEPQLALPWHGASGSDAGLSGDAEAAKRQWLSEVSIMQHTIRALQEQVARGGSARSDSVGRVDSPVAANAPPSALAQPGWAAAMLHGQLVHLRARFGGEAADCAEEEAAACVEQAARECSAQVPCEPPSEAHAEPLSEHALRRALAEARADWEVEVSESQQARRGTVEGPSPRCNADNDTHAAVASLQAEVTHLRLALSQRCDREVELEEALAEAVKRAVPLPPPPTPPEDGADLAQQLADALARAAASQKAASSSDASRRAAAAAAADVIGSLESQLSVALAQAHPHLEGATARLFDRCSLLQAALDAERKTAREAERAWRARCEAASKARDNVALERARGESPQGERERGQPATEGSTALEGLQTCVESLQAALQTEQQRCRELEARLLA